MNNIYNSFAHVYDCLIDDVDYKKSKRYDLTLVTRNPDDPLIDKIESLKYCSLDRSYVSDNLNHYSYTIYF